MVKDEHGEPESGMFSYSSVVGILLYLSGHNFPDVNLVTNFYAQYMFSPKRSHKLSLKKLACYLKQTKDSGFGIEY